MTEQVKAANSKKKQPSAKVRARAERDRKMDEQLRKNFYDPEKKRKHRKNVRIGFCVCLGILVLMSVLNWGIVTGWGNVSIDRINMVGDDGAEYSALVYRPSNATDKTPAPAIVCFHGNAGNARNHESWAVEFARRGFVVVSIDQFGSGDSQGYFDGGANGAFSSRALVEEADMFYRYTMDLPFVDSSNIISSGHSMGGTAALTVGAKYNAKCILGASTKAFFKEDVPSAKSQEYMDYWNNYKGDVAIMYGTVEMTDTAAQAEGLKILKRYPGYENATDFELGKTYGSFADGNGCTYILEPDRIHEAAFVSTQTIGNLLKYGQAAIGDAVPHYIDSSDQVWMYKDYTGLFGIFAFAAFLFSFALLLIEEVPAFERVKRPLARNVGFRGPGLVIASIVCLLVPYLVCKTDAFGIVGGANYTNLKAAGFNLGFSNMGFGVVIGLNIVAAIGLVVYMLTEGRKYKVKASDLGLTPADYDATAPRGKRIGSVVDMILRSLLLTMIVVGVGWAYLQLQVDVFGTDFYAWFFGVKDIPIDKIPNYLNYLGIFILCFIVASIDMNVERRLPTTGSETKDVVIAIVVNVLLCTTMIVIIVAVKWYLQTIGSPADTNWLWNMGMDTQRIWGLPVGMGVAVAGSTFIYKKTGNIWLCALLIGTVACLMGLLYGSTRFNYLTFFYN